MAAAETPPPNHYLTNDERPNPDALLSSLRREEAAKKRGRLKVFLGMCPGVGKTFAMLESAQRELAAGRDVVIGYVETHGRKETDALTAGLPQIDRRQLVHRGLTLTEFDLDATLARRPQTALVDELAHTNAPGSRHPKRWQDVRELLDAGIDVTTTLNVQHVESRADTVKQVTGAEIREIVPDSILDDAIIELVDLPPAELVQRLQQGKVYLPDRAAAAAQNFFREGNLTALRELALRLVADHVGVDTREFRQQQTGAGLWKTGHCLLVAVGAGPYSESLIRWTRHMADGLKCRWVAAHVESPNPLPEAAQTQLEKNLSTARELGAEVIATTDDDLARGLLRVAREQNATQIILGKSGGNTAWEWLRGNRLLRRMVRESGDIDLHVVRAEKTAGPAASPFWRPLFASSVRQYGFAAGTIGATGVLNYGLMQLTGSPRVPGFVFLLAVVLLAIRVGRGPGAAGGRVERACVGFLFPCRRVTHFSSAAWRTRFCSAFILWWPSCWASLWRASASRNRPNAAAKNGRRRCMKCRATWARRLRGMKSCGSFSRRSTACFMPRSRWPCRWMTGWFCIPTVRWRFRTRNSAWRTGPSASARPPGGSPTTCRGRRRCICRSPRNARRSASSPSVCRTSA